MHKIIGKTIIEVILFAFVYDLTRSEKTNDRKSSHIHLKITLHAIRKGLYNHQRFNMFCFNKDPHK